MYVCMYVCMYVYIYKIKNRAYACEKRRIRNIIHYFSNFQLLQLGCIAQNLTYKAININLQLGI